MAERRKKLFDFLKILTIIPAAIFPFYLLFTEPNSERVLALGKIGGIMFMIYILLINLPEPRKKEVKK